MDYVIALHNEDVTWLNEAPLTEEDIVFIYNKGREFNIDTLELPCSLIYVPLENKGREGHTYIYHIARYYTTIADHVAFLQGNPFDHIDRHDLYNRLTLREDWTWLTRWIAEDDMHGKRYHGSLLRIEEVYEKYFYKPCPQMFLFGAGCQFITTRERIQSRSKYFYQELLKDFDTRLYMPWEFERMAKNIFYD
jgi:hypothetical protein